MKKKSTHFDKFTKKKSNAAIKEQFKQEKRKIKKEREEFFEKKRAEAKSQKTEAGGRKKEVGSRRSEEGSNRHPSTSSGATGNKQPVASNQQPVTGNRQPATANQQQTTGLMPLNKFLAHSGISGRREAADIVKQGKVKVNNIVVTEPGHKVSANDDIRVNGKKIFLAKNLVYILLNKPKDF